jgi:hypothetical protein
MAISYHDSYYHGESKWLLIDELQEYTSDGRTISVAVSQMPKNSELLLLGMESTIENDDSVHACIILSKEEAAAIADKLLEYVNS